jgi:hypothetical protein
LASPEFVKLAADIVAFNAEWRKKMAGVQVTEQELKFMDDIMATYKDNPVNAAMKIESFKQMTVDSLNSVRESYALPRLTEETLNDNNKRVKIYELNLEEKELYDSGYSLEQIKQLKEAQ